MLNQELIEYIERHRIDYEKRYGIKIYTWFVRKSTIRGLSRKSSDLDVVFLFLDDKDKFKLIFERADRRNEFQCYSLKDAWKLLLDNKKNVMESADFKIVEASDTLKHYVFDYYNGVACSIGNPYIYRNPEYVDFENLVKECYEPLVAARQLFKEGEDIYRKLEIGYEVSLNQMINALWSVNAAITILCGRDPGDVDIRNMRMEYLSPEEKNRIIKMVAFFKKSNQKQSNYSRFSDEKKILRKLLNVYFDFEEKYECVDIDIEKIEKEANEWFAEQLGDGR